MKGDFANSRIYRIVCNETGLNYYGSTTQTLSKRLGAHVSNYKSWQDGKYHFVTSFSVLEAGDYEIVLVEKLEGITNREQLRAVERRYIEGNECVNKHIPGRTIVEYNAQRYQDNRDHILKQNAQYYQDNREHLLKQAVQYRQDHREEISAKRAQRYQDNKDEISAKQSVKVQCQHCGSFVGKGSFARHQKSAKCLAAQRVLEL